MKFRISFQRSRALIIITIFLLLLSALPVHAALWGNKTDINTEDFRRIVTELRIYDDPDLPYYNEIFKLHYAYYTGSKELLAALNKKIEITQQVMKILDADIKKEELGNLTYGRYILNAINEEELVEMGLKTGCSPDQANGEYFSKLGENLADWKSQLSKLLLTKIIVATCTAMGAPALSIGISTLGLFCDLSIIGTSINKLNEVWYEKAFWSYIQFRNELPNYGHTDAWTQLPESYINHIFILSPEKQKKAREAIEEHFESLWNKYGDHIVNNELDKNFKNQQRESLKILLLYALEAEPHPIITSPLKITPPSPYQVGDKINAEFTITNQGMLPINFSVLTVGGRDPDDQVTDFTHRQNITLESSESYNYQGTLTLNKVGDYHFFCTYQTPDDEWNTNVDLGSKLTDEDRVDDIYVKEKIVNQPPDPPANLAQFKSDGKIILKIGKTTTEQTVILKAKISDPDGNKVKLQIELRRLDEYEGKFDEEKEGLQQSDLFENNSEIMIPIYGLADGDYHWRARAIDEHGIVSEWVSFGGNPDSAVDFTVGQEVVAPVITSPLKITPNSPYYVGDTINAEFAITNKDSIPITFSVLTVGGRDPDDHVADFTHRQNIIFKPFESYNYQGTLTLNKVGEYHFFCTYQTPDGNWNTCVDLGPRLASDDIIENITAMETIEDKIEKEITFKTFNYKDDYAEYSVKYPDWPNIPEAKFTHVGLKKSLDVGYSKEVSVHMIISQDFDLMDLYKFLREIPEDLEKEVMKRDTIEFYLGTTKIIKAKKTYNGNFMEVLLDLDGEFFKKDKADIDAFLNSSKIHVLFKDFYCKENNKYFSVSVTVVEDKWSKYQNVAQFIINSMKVTKIEKEKLLIDSSLYHIECNKPIVSGNIFVVIPVSVRGPADELALILTNPKGETDIRFISKRALIDNFETVKLRMGNAPLSEGPYILTVKTVTPEKVIYKTELWFTSPDVSIADAEFTYEITHLGGAYGYAGYYFLEITSLTLINNGDLPAKRDTNKRALITLDGKPENMTLLTRRYSISPYEIDFYPPTYITSGKNKVPERHLHAVDAMYGLKKGNYFVTITIPIVGGETVSFKKALTIE